MTTFERLLALHKDSTAETWVQHGELARRVRTQVFEESRASEIHSFHPSSIPGLFRTPDHMLATTGVEQPASRQDILWNAAITCYLGHSALDRLDHEQVVHLLLIPAIVRIVPTGAPCGYEAFTLLTGPKRKPVVYLDTEAATIYLGNSAHIAPYERAVAELSAMALSVEASRDLLNP